MADLQVKTKFEFLPNELLMECFKYLDACEIFKSFDFLNSRFSQVIRSIPLHLSVGAKEKSALVQFGVMLLLNPQVKKRITTLVIMRNTSTDDLNTLLSFISWEEFSGLQVVAILDTNRYTMMHLSAVLPRLANLRYFYLATSPSERFGMLSSLPTSTLQTLIVPSISFYSLPAGPFTSLTDLTVHYCSVDKLCDFFRYSPQLQRLNIKIFSRSINPISKKSDLSDLKLIHLERLIIDHCDDSFDNLETLLQRTPHLKVLSVFALDSNGIADARRWQKLIKNSLTSLDVFKFDFCFGAVEENQNFLNDFRRFQTDFWTRQHHWYTEYVINANRAFIHAIPYMCNEYCIAPKTDRFCNLSNDHHKIFAKVTDLTLDVSEMTNNSQYYFANVASLTLSNANSDQSDNYPFLKTKHIDGLKTMINLRNLTHLEMTSDFRWKSPSVVSQLFSEPFHIASLKIDKTLLFSMFQKRDLCDRLNNRITKLEINDHVSADEMEKVCQIFYNMKQFQCSVDRINTFQIIIGHLSKLSSMKVFTYRTYGYSIINIWLRDNQSEMKLYPFVIKCEDADNRLEYHSYDSGSHSDVDFDQNDHYLMDDDSEPDYDMD